MKRITESIESTWIDVIKTGKVYHLAYRCYLTLIGAEERQRFEIAEAYEIIENLR